MHSDDLTHIRVFDVEGDALSGDRIFHVVRRGRRRFSMRYGRECLDLGGGWRSCISPDGVLLGKILVPELVSNVCFGGRAKHVLFITATTSVYAIP